MGAMSQQVEHVHGLISQMSGMLQEQHQGLGQILASVSELDQLTQQNAAMVEETAAAAESLREQSQLLSGAVAQFRLESGAKA